MKTGLYIHIPFCEQRCYYCAFTVAVAPENTFAPYVDRLIAEMGLAGFSEEPETVYFGGGTPSMLPGNLMARVRGAIRGTPREISVEVNPGTLSDEKLAIYRDCGITRMSLGAQSLEDEDLRRAGRLHNAAAVLSDVVMIRRHGFQNLNLDLIAGLPQQNLDVWRRNLEGVVRIQPEHISLYMLDREERSAWRGLDVGVPDESDYAAFYSEAESRLDAAGYKHYEISNWCLPGFECRHNLGYWNGTPYRGFGVGAHSYDGVRRYWNTSSLADYAGAIDRGELPLAEQELLTREIRVEETFMLGLRQAAGLNIPSVVQRLGLELPQEWFVRAEQLRDAGLIEFDGTTLQLTAPGRLAANSVIEELLWPTPSSTFEATR